MGVTHSGMLLAHEVTGDERFAEYTRRQLQFIADRLPYFREAVAKGARPGKETFGAILRTGSLDDSGSMCAALVKARQKGVGPDLKAVIDHWATTSPTSSSGSRTGPSPGSAPSPSRCGPTTST